MDGAKGLGSPAYELFYGCFAGYIHREIRGFPTRFCYRGNGCLTALALTSATVTSAPSDANRCAMPLPAPVITMCLSINLLQLVTIAFILLLQSGLLTISLKQRHIPYSVAYSHQRSAFSCSMLRIVDIDPFPRRRKKRSPAGLPSFSCCQGDPLAFLNIEFPGHRAALFAVKSLPHDKRK